MMELHATHDVYAMCTLIIVFQQNTFGQTLPLSYNLEEAWPDYMYLQCGVSDFALPKLGPSIPLPN